MPFITKLRAGFVLKQPIPFEIENNGLVCWREAHCLTLFLDGEDPEEILMEFVCDKFQYLIDMKSIIPQILKNDLITMEQYIELEQPFWRGLLAP